MKKIFLITLLFSASFIQSQEVPEPIRAEYLMCNLNDGKSFDDFMDLRSETLSKSLTEFIESFNKLGEFVPVVQAGDWGEEDKKLEYKASYAIDINKTGVPIRELKLEVVESICSMANTEGGKIIIGVNFISEQILSDNEDDIVKNKDTWVFEKPENSNGPVWTLVST